MERHAFLAKSLKETKTRWEGIRPSTRKQYESSQTYDTAMISASLVVGNNTNVEDECKKMIAGIKVLTNNALLA
ncbi:MAG: hypothetical protein H0T62_10220 [Parachlamydiaceae bacterium]|nr:hypothetical protein [Parachlamydiaceae bacterium]